MSPPRKNADRLAVVGARRCPPPSGTCSNPAAPPGAPAARHRTTVTSNSEGGGGGAGGRSGFLRYEHRAGLELTPAGSTVLAAFTGGGGR